MRDRAARQGTHDLVFHAPRLTDADKPWKAANCSHAVTKLLVEAGCPLARSHTFRKAVATRLANAGVPLQQVSNQLGHADPSFTASVHLGRDFQGDKSNPAQHF